jgi:hypothetical protein
LCRHVLSGFAPSLILIIIRIKWFQPRITREAGGFAACVDDTGAGVGADGVCQLAVIGGGAARKWNREPQPSFDRK